MKTTPLGLRVEFKPDSESKIQHALVPFLLQRGFKRTSPIFFMIPDSPKMSPRISAYFTGDITHPGFTVGKITSSFTAEEVQLMDQCVVFMIDHSDSIVSGRLVDRATSPSVRERFYSRIKKAE